MNVGHGAVPFVDDARFIDRIIKIGQDGIALVTELARRRDEVFEVFFAGKCQNKETFGGYRSEIVIA